MINKKNEITAPEINLFPIQGKNIELGFSGDRISSDGGLLLLRELDSQLNLLSSAGNCIHDERDHRYIDHSVRELSTQRVFQIAAGYEDCNDCNDLREDMIFKLCAGRLPHSGNDLASQPTMSRLENSATKTGLFRLGEIAMTRTMTPMGNRRRHAKLGMTPAKKWSEFFGGSLSFNSFEYFGRGVKDQYVENPETKAYICLPTQTCDEESYKSISSFKSN